VTHAEYTNDDGVRVPLKSVLCTSADEEYLKKEFVGVVQKRGQAVLEAMSRSSAASAANAAIEHVHDWVLGTKPGEWASMGVCSDGNAYGIEEGLIFSFPCECKDGQWKIASGLTLTPFDREMLTKTVDELKEERALAFGSTGAAAASS
jgi:malate dehydrogenase